MHLTTLILPVKPLPSLQKPSLRGRIGLLRAGVQMSSIMHPNIRQRFWEAEHVHAVRTRQQTDIFMKAERTDPGKSCENVL